jgi:hypothetical protein
LHTGVGRVGLEKAGRDGRAVHQVQQGHRDDVGSKRPVAQRLERQIPVRPPINQRVEARRTLLRPLDAVGAGDSFNAGMLYGTLAGWSLTRSLQLGAVCGSLSTREAGGTAAQPTLAEALTYMTEAS